MSCPEDCCGGIVFLKPPFPSRSYRVRWIDDDLPCQGVAIRSDELLHCIEIDRKDDDLGFANRVRDRHGFGIGAELAGKLLRFREGLVGDDDLLATDREIFCQSGTDVSETDDRGVHDERAPFCLLCDLLLNYVAGGFVGEKL